MTTDITELAQSLKAAAEKATPGRIGDRIDGSGSIKYECHGYDGSLVLRTDHKNMRYGFVGDNSFADEEFFRACVPDAILALVEALELKEEQRANWFQMAQKLGEDLDAAEKRNAELVEALEKAQTINAAAEKLVRCKGRYHSEQNYRALAALFGVNTPDLPPLEHENVHYADAADMEIAALRQRIAEMVHQKSTLIKFIRDSCYVFDGYDADISDAYVDAISSELMPKLESVAAVNPPLFWVRVKSDGGYDGPVHDSQLEEVRKKSGEWLPLTLALRVPDLESRTVTVKPMRPGHITVGGEKIGIYMRDEVDEFLAALTAAGIKWEAE